jgi:type IV secretory pathway VirB10-like protein
MRVMRGWTVALLCLLPALANAESLADVARQAAEKRKKPTQTEKTTRVYGADDLQSAKEKREAEKPPASAAEGEAAAGTRHAETPSPATSDDSDRQLENDRARREADEAAWRKRVAEATERLDAARERYDGLKGLTVYPGQYVVDGQGRTVAESGEEYRRLVEQAKAELDTAQRAYDDLLEAARREGVQPGWLR